MDIVSTRSDTYEMQVTERKGVSTSPPMAPAPRLEEPPTAATSSALSFSSRDAVACGYQVGVGSLCGYVSGMAMRKFGALAAYTLGTGFIILQSLQYSGHLTVNWRKVERDYVSLLDIDRDGEVTTKDLGLWGDKLKDILIFDLPAGVGFSGGWIMGVGGPTTLAGGVGAAGALYGVSTRVLLPRIAATTGVTTGGPAALVAAQNWWDQTRARLVGEAPEEQFKRTIVDYDYAQLKKLDSQFQREHQRAGKLLAFDLQMLEMKQRVVHQRLLEVPPPAKSWWHFW